MTMGINKIIYWHREIPPVDAEQMEEHTVEATSCRVPGTIAHRDELWDHCYTDLMVQVLARLEQEVARLGGDYAHVVSESVNSKHDAITSEAWLQDNVTYMLYRRTQDILLGTYLL
jgi:hypothetical protein